MLHNNWLIRAMEVISTCQILFLLLSRVEGLNSTSSMDRHNSWEASRTSVQTVEETHSTFSLLPITIKKYSWLISERLNKIVLKFNQLDLQTSRIRTYFNTHISLRLIKRGTNATIETTTINRHILKHRREMILSFRALPITTQQTRFFPIQRFQLWEAH